MRAHRKSRATVYRRRNVTRSGCRERLARLRQTRCPAASAEELLAVLDSARFPGQSSAAGLGRLDR